jgi:prepilin-type N-terminal cleavage/methylation domain-containing protein
MSRFHAPRAGVTLIELVVALMVLGVISGLAIVTVRRTEQVKLPDPAIVTARRARSEAIATGRAVSFVVGDSTHRRRGTAFPDGSLVAEGLAADPLTGAPNARP